TARMDSATAAQSDRTGASAASNRRFIARTGSARVNSRGTEIDPGYRTRRGTVKPGLRQRARFGRAENVASANPETEIGIAKVTRSAGVWCKPRKRTERSGIISAAFAKRNPRNAGTSGKAGESAG